MPKEAKKEVKKAFPLENTQQSNAYKQQVKVTDVLSRKKAQYCLPDQKSN
jgi:hypothetical protein